MLFVSKTLAGKSGKYFVAQQTDLGAENGFIEEMMKGQKVVTVFCHEEESVEAFDKINDELCQNATQANRFANILMPIMANIGNILYVLFAFIGGVLILTPGVHNVSLSCQAL